MSDLRDSIRRVVGNNYIVNKTVCLAKIKETWEKIAAADWKLQPYDFDYKKKILVLVAETSGWADEARFHTAEILEKLRGANLKVEIKGIEIKGIVGYDPQKNIKKENPAETESALPADPLEKLLAKARNLAKQDARPVCPVCGERFEGTGEICIRCVNEQTAREEKEILRNLEEAPWAKYEEFNFSTVTLERFAHIKYLLRERTLDKIRQMYLDYYEKPLPPQQRGQAQSLAMKYVLLKTGLTPDKISDNIISNQFSKKLYKFIYG